MSISTSEFSQFHLFFKLPYELRLEIWRLALPPPRMVELRKSGMARKRKKFWISDICPPILLRVCHEAREIALESYQSISAWHQTRPLLTKSYIDYSKDIFCLPAWSYKKSLYNAISSGIEGAPIAFDKVRYFAVIFDQFTTQHNQWSHEGSALLENYVIRRKAVRFLTSIFIHFRNLKQLLLVTHQSPELQEGMDELLEPTDAPKNSREKRIRETAIEEMSGLLEEVQARNTNLTFPSIDFKILTRSQYTPLPERGCDGCLRCLLPCNPVDWRI